jgi:hypothetical protein
VIESLIESSRGSGLEWRTKYELSGRGGESGKHSKSSEPDKGLVSVNSRVCT